MWFKDANEFKETMGYELEDGWYPRVTKILDVKAKTGLDSFFREMGHYAAAESVKNKSAEEGSRVHDVIQRHLAGELMDVPRELTHVVSAFEKFNKQQGIFFHPEFVERRIWSGFHRYAGTVDALASIGGKFGVLDIKTSTGFFPEYNLQTAAYVLALQEASIKKALGLARDIETRWILRIDQNKVCALCGAKLREKGGRTKIRQNRTNGKIVCADNSHQWGPIEGEIELKEFPYFYRDIKAFLAAKTLWEWENDYWLRQVGYLK
ncbi:hypothetical protein A3J56_00990 [Candidatus Giovannonibacteria bacterium RIFCSPHIGHO2_02_FULL_46_20]|uniref:PD-(D/E)XK endonuclease-like domain-containing protein n=1 Tax=Candidatus Giovannonibacteria bacterium RIFCSPHIGHO2_02_FULL_46_20 TaxID=1798338 RepID=A0A1F5WFV8_9BACT|nr:MAG: hypothetical protein A3J56_00990 [Candidatus Giovannonibacteria bacterium RIFCSPHIGHO2_02_FULL_46_20]